MKQVIQKKVATLHKHLKFSFRSFVLLIKTGFAEVCKHIQTSGRQRRHYWKSILEMNW